MMNETLTTSRYAKLGLVAVALLVFAFTFSSLTAQAGAQLPAACEQYPDLPQCIDDDGGGDDNGDGGDLGPGDGDGTGDLNTAGSLPFTGYPMSAIVLLMLALLLAGIAIRAYTAARERYDS